MSGLQTIIQRAAAIGVNRRKVVGIQITRNEIARTSITPTRNPWRFTIQMPASLKWYNNRDLIEALDNLDRYQPQTVTFNNTCLSWMFDYQGLMTSGMISGLTVLSYTGNQLTLQNLNGAGVTNGTVMFRPGDFIQIGTLAHPVTVVNTVTATAANTITFQVSRPNFLGTVASQGITVGPACQFKVFCPNMPTYRLTPGGYVADGSTILNKGLIEFSDEFELYEWTGDV
jgi:hypothetical protein